MTDTVLRLAQSEDATAVSLLAYEAKKSHGYDEAFMQKAINSVTFSTDQCSSFNMIVAEQDGVIVGFYELADINPPTGQLESLYVGKRGEGIGGYLLRHAAYRAFWMGVKTLTITSDPHTTSFYEHAGAKYVGETPSRSFPGRTLPRYELSLTDI